jgi:hypothetical protein
MCYCQTGFCAGADGKCYDSKNKLVSPPGFTLRNAQWDKLYMDVEDMKVVAGEPGQEPGHDLEVQIRELPPANSGAYLLSNAGGSVLRCARVGSWVKAEGLCVVTSVRRDTWWGGYDTKPVRTLAFRLEEPPKHVGRNARPDGMQALLIESIQDPGSYLAVTELSSLMMAADGGEGARTNWIAEPPLSISLAPNSGPHCTFGCGAYGAGSRFGQRFWGELAAAVISTLITLCLCLCCCLYVVQKPPL